MSSFWKKISVFQFIMSSPRNLDLFSNDDVISWNGETDECKETILPRNHHLFPNFSRESYLLERRNRYFGETVSLAPSDCTRQNYFSGLPYDVCLILTFGAFKKIWF